MKELPLGGGGFGAGKSCRPALLTPTHSIPPRTTNTDLCSLSEDHCSIRALPPRPCFMQHKDTSNNPLPLFSQEEQR